MTRQSRDCGSQTWWQLVVGPVKAQPWSPFIPGNEKKKDIPALMAEKK